ncbi:hypothetical protein ACFOUP_00500 [Belliella kenyensis]|uniref:Uncharacterized protein n=1 Tax=Belliella kenyensis TaxID=1472724 RepID=A0ABV8EI74_9BACT|nr:hypothetical protein [Belliella kenyensis]MCH7401834.1 hypothetical protein [Belliella kenyensis]MDN3604334.1 hypothetical protein [Belliella kenyensis]
MKAYIIKSLVFLLIIIHHTSFSQVRNFDLSKIDAKSKRIARKEYIKCVGEDFNEWIFARIDSKKLDFLTVASFEFSDRILSYKEGIPLEDYLKPMKKPTLSDIYVFQKGEYEGVMSLIDKIYNPDIKYYCNYTDSKDFTNEFDYHTGMYKALEVLKKHNFSFLFSVKYIRNCIWFIENEKVWLLNLENMKIYEPDLFISEFCTIETLQQNVLGKFERYCY